MWVSQESDLKKLGSAEVLIVHGSEDTKVPPKVAQFIFARLSKTKRFGSERVKMIAAGTHDMVAHESELREDLDGWLDRTFVDEL